MPFLIKQMITFNVDKARFLFFNLNIFFLCVFYYKFDANKSVYVFHNVLLCSSANRYICLVIYTSHCSYILAYMLLEQKILIFKQVCK